MFTSGECLLLHQHFVEALGMARQGTLFPFCQSNMRLEPSRCNHFLSISPINTGKMTIEVWCNFCRDHASVTLLRKISHSKQNKQNMVRGQHCSVHFGLSCNLQCGYPILVPVWVQAAPFAIQLPEMSLRKQQSMAQPEIRMNEVPGS